MPSPETETLEAPETTEPVVTKEPSPEQMLEESIKSIRVEKGFDKEEPAEKKPVEEKASEESQDDLNKPLAEKPEIDSPDPTTEEKKEPGLMVEGEDLTVDQVSEKVSELATKLGLDSKDAELLLQANFKKRFGDTRKSFNERSEELAVLKKQADEGPPAVDKPSDSQDDASSVPDSDIFADLSDDVKTVLEETPELKELFLTQEKRSEARTKQLMAEMMAEQQSKSDSVTDEQRDAQKSADWREGINKAIPEGLKLYESPEFIDWETQNANKIRAVIGHYDTHDPLGAIEEIRMYQKEKGLLSEAKETQKQERKQQRSDTAGSPNGSSIPSAKKRGQPADDDHEAHMRYAIDLIHKEKRYSKPSPYGG